MSSPSMLIGCPKFARTLALAEHGAGAKRRGDGEAGGGAAGVGGQRDVRWVPIPGRAGHALRPVGAPLLQGLLHVAASLLHQGPSTSSTRYVIVLLFFLKRPRISFSRMPALGAHEQHVCFNN